VCPNNMGLPSIHVGFHEFREPLRERRAGVLDWTHY
jgi:hypothetical protein